MKKVLITGSGGLIGSEAVNFFIKKGFQVVGIDNDMRKYFFGSSASTRWKFEELKNKFANYEHHDFDIRNKEKLEQVFKNNKFDLIIHTAAQPSHDWAAKEPFTDFEVNATSTLYLLEFFRQHCPDAVFIFTSTNKVYGDTPNKLDFKERETRFELAENHENYSGFDESLTIDQSTHSIFGSSKVAADILVQEYGRYFDLKTVTFRGGCLTGSEHSGAPLHGFLAYLGNCIATGTKYTINGYKGKQVRDNIHAFDLVNAFYHFYLNPKIGAVYNMGGSRFANISIIEAIKKFEDLLGKKANTEYSDKPRQGDHIWYISNVNKFMRDYPDWNYKYSIDDTLLDISNKHKERINGQNK